MADLKSQLGFSGEDAASDFMARNKNALLYGGAAILLVIGGAWYVNRSNTLKEERAGQAYATALQTAASGNIPLAQTDLQKMALRYRGTAAGTSGSLALAKLYYDEGKFQEGIDAISSASPDDMTKFDVAMLKATGLEGLSKYEEAANEFKNAVNVARFDADKDLARAAAARAFVQAGKKDEAIAMWKEIAENPKSRSYLEAQIRIGELEAAPAGA